LGSIRIGSNVLEPSADQPSRTRHDHGVNPDCEKVAYVAVGDLTEVGFSLAAGLLLVVGHQGRGVVEVETGAVIARDGDEQGDWFAPARPAALGLGPVAGHWIEVCGLAGGHLRQRRDDGWRLSVQAGGAAAVHEAGRREPFVVAETEELRAAGFSNDGHTMIVAAASGVTVCRCRYEPQ